jgi:nitrogen fixation protein NifU and related proteins
VSDELQDLYQDVVLDHGKRPRNFGELLDANRTAEGYNPLCGDQIKLFVKLDGDVLRDVRFTGSGCAISKASASLMTGAVKDHTRAEALALFEKVHALVTRGPESGVTPESVGKLAALSGVWEFPARVKCASLAWHTLRSALEGKAEKVSTE